MIFDVKMESYFTHKAILDFRTHTTDPPSAITYSIVVNRESVRTASPIYTLNDLDIISADIDNDYLDTPC